MAEDAIAKYAHEHQANVWVTDFSLESAGVLDSKEDHDIMAHVKERISQLERDKNDTLRLMRLNKQCKRCIAWSEFQPC